MEQALILVQQKALEKQKEQQKELRKGLVVTRVEFSKEKNSLSFFTDDNVEASAMIRQIPNGKIVCGISSQMPCVGLRPELLGGHGAADYYFQGLRWGVTDGSFFGVARLLWCAPPIVISVFEGCIQNTYILANDEMERDFLRAMDEAKAQWGL